MSHMPSSPGEVVASLPLLLPDHAQPEPGMVVLIGRAPGVSGALILVGKLEPHDEAVGVAEELLGAACADGACSVAVIVYASSHEEAAPPFSRLAQVAAAVVLRAAGHGLTVMDALRVADGRWASYLCTNPSCCPPEGSPIPTPEEH